MEITDEKRSQLKKIVITILSAFLLIYGIIMYFKYTTPAEVKNKTGENNSIIFTQPDLQIFSYHETLNMYPDRVLMHYPYFLVIKPKEFKSTIYNIETKKKEKTIPEIVLDYYKGDTVYNKQGIETYLNEKNLKILCDQAFIKSTQEILCITRPDKNQIANKLISINPQTLKQKEIYKSANVRTAIYFQDDNLYIGEYNFTTNKSYLVFNNKTIPAPDLINVIYPMNNEIYLASLKSKKNELQESYAEFNNQKLTIKKIDNNHIVFYINNE